MTATGDVGDGDSIRFYAVVIRFDCDLSAIRPPLYPHSTAILALYDHSTSDVTTVGLPVPVVGCCTVT